MSFYLIDNSGNGTFINNKYLRTRLLTGKIDDDSNTLDTMVLEEINDYPEEVRIILNKIFIEKPAFYITDIINVLFRDFSEENEKEYLYAMLTLEKSHFLGIVYLYVSGFVNKEGVIAFLEMTTLKNRTELLLTYLDRDEQGVNIFDQLERRIQELSNFKNNFEIYNSSDFKKISSYLTKLVSYDDIFDEYFYKKNFKLTYKHYLQAKEDKVGENIFNMDLHLLDKWILHQLSYDMLLDDDIPQLEKDILNLDKLIFDLKNMGAGQVVTGTFIQDMPTGSYENRQSYIRSLEGELNAKKEILAEKYMAAARYDNNDFIELDLNDVFYKSINALLPEMINLKFCDRGNSEVNDSFVYRQGYGSPLMTAFVKHFSDALKDNIRESTENLQVAKREVVKNSNAALTSLKDRLFESFMDTNPYEFKENHFIKSAKKGDIITGPTTKVPNNFLEYRASDTPLAPLYKDFSYITNSVGRIYNLIDDGYNSIKDIIHTLSPSDLDKILHTNLLITKYKEIRTPKPGLPGDYFVDTITNYKITEDETLSFIPQLHIDDKNECLLTIRFVDSEQVFANLYTCNVDPETAEFSECKPWGLPGTKYKDYDVNIEFVSYLYEPNFSADIYIRKLVGINQEDNTPVYRYGEKIRVRFEKDDITTGLLIRQNLDVKRRFFIDNFGTSCIYRQFNDVISALNEKIKELNGGAAFTTKHISISLLEILPKLKEECIKLIPSYKTKDDNTPTYLYVYVFDIILDFLDYLMDDTDTGGYVPSISESTYIFYQEQFIERQLLISMSEIAEEIPQTKIFEGLQELEGGIKND